MHRKFIALISGLALTVAITAASTAPARADNDAAKVLAGIAALAIIGAAIDNNNRPTVVERRVIVRPPRPVYAPPRQVYVAPPRPVFVQPRRPVYVQPQRNVYIHREVNREVNIYRAKPGKPYQGHGNRHDNRNGQHSEYQQRVMR